MAECNSIEPLYRVASQLKTFIAVGIATRNVRNENIVAATSEIPLVNMW